MLKIEGIEIGKHLCNPGIEKFFDILEEVKRRANNNRDVVST